MGWRLRSWSFTCEGLGLKHQVCLFHLLRCVNRALKELEGELSGEWQGVIDAVRRIVAELLENGGRLLFLLWQRLPARAFLERQAQSFPRKEAG